ncbi:MAG: AAA family ATPase, partial [Gammaproteobacteria bacterium]|nr:AAA family ATPase [Gammaproteobacteria bacterium]
MNRNILNSLKKWKSDAKRKPLLLMGARQVGKTYILEIFGRTEYSNYLYLNFEDMPTLGSLFSKSLDPHDIIKVLSIEKNVKIYPHETLIIFDEIQ